MIHLCNGESVDSDMKAIGLTGLLLAEFLIAE